MYFILYFLKVGENTNLDSFVHYEIIYVLINFIHTKQLEVEMNFFMWIRNIIPKHPSIIEANDRLDFFTETFSHHDAGATVFNAIVRIKIEGIINKSYNDFTKTFDSTPGKATEWVTAQVGNISADLLESGSYCAYRGFLSLSGESLWYYYCFALDEMLKFSIDNPDDDPIDEKWVEEQKRILQKNISKIG